MNASGRGAYSAAGTSSPGSQQQQGGSVLAAWNVVEPQFPAPYPDMPPAAAAAVSPVVPSTATQDPYGRCWQGQVDAGACFPYFGTFYGSSLPPSSYRMQPGCMSNIGQFWPPTPPPDGCIRYDGANNLHFCPPLTPVFRHGDSLPQNVLGVQRYGHYPHLLDVNTDASIKRVDTSMDSSQKQKMLLVTKHSRSPQQKLCHCYECNERNYSRHLVPSVNKENMNSSVKMCELKYSEEKSKCKNYKKLKENFDSLHSRNPVSYANTSAISNCNSSLDQNMVKGTTAMQTAQNPQEFSSREMIQKTDNVVMSSVYDNHVEFSKSENAHSIHNSKVSSDNFFPPVSSMSGTSSLATLGKGPEAFRMENPVDRIHPQQLQMPASSSFESCPCAHSQATASSSKFPPKSCCFSVPIPAQTPHNCPERPAHNKGSGAFIVYGNGSSSYNASPLKNVYFSYYESENCNLMYGNTDRKFNKATILGKPEKMTNMIPENNQAFTDYSCAPIRNCDRNMTSVLNNMCTSERQQMATSSYSQNYPVQSSDQHKDTSFCNYIGTANVKRKQCSKRSARITTTHIKQERPEVSACKFEQSCLTKECTNTSIPQLPVATASRVLNLSTSVKILKKEPEDILQRRDFSSETVISRASSFSIDLCDKNMVENSNRMDQVYIPEFPVAHRPVENCSKSDANDFWLNKSEADCAPTIPEDLVSVGQVAPPIADITVLSKMPTTGCEAPLEAVTLPTHDVCSQAEAQLCSLESAPQDVAEEPCLEQHSPCTPVLLKEKDDIQEMNSVFDLIAEDSDMPVLEPEGEVHMPENDKTIPVCNSVGSFMKNLTLKTPENFESVDNKVLCEVKDTVDDVICRIHSILETERNSLNSVLEAQALNNNSTFLENTTDTSFVLGECHGLYLLLEGIAHRNSMNDNAGTAQETLSYSASTDGEMENKDNQHLHKMQQSLPYMKGLNLLCALVEKELVPELHIKKEDGITAEESNIASVSIISNYPCLKDELTEVSNSCDNINRKISISEESQTPEIEMRKQLAELQQKYKQKQKELARLRSKKTKSSDVSNTSHCSSDGSSKSSTSNSSSYSKDSNKLTARLKSRKHFHQRIKTTDKSSLITDKSSKEANLGPNNDISETPVNCERLEYKEIIAQEKLNAATVKKNFVTARQKLQLRSKRMSPRFNEKSKSRLKGALKANKGLRAIMLNGENTGILPRKLGEVREEERKVNTRSTSRLLTSSIKKDDDIKISHSLSKKLKLEPTSGENRTSSEVVNTTRESKKRKSATPKKFMPVKQIRLTETIITKQLRTRILLGTPHGLLENDDKEQEFKIPEDLSEALGKCCLNETSENCSNCNVPNQSSIECSNCDAKVIDDKCKEIFPDMKRSLRMTVTDLVENQRILAIEDGLFYAGCLREIQTSDVYGVVLDGQRGNKKHIFSQEEMLTQTILELKPNSTDDLPEGTRVCAYWSHQYRCLYPGTVVKAPSPSPDWSEPRVYVEFDDGDSAQIATKNIRYLPNDLPILNQDAEKTGGLSNGSPNSMMYVKKEKPSVDDSHIKTLRKKNKQASSSNASPLNCTEKSSVSEDNVISISTEPSRTSENSSCTTVQLQKNNNPSRRKLSRTANKLLKKTSYESKDKQKIGVEVLQKKKKHKKYKDRHKHCHHHHHHHHHHHKHCHHRRHCKKHRHHRKDVENFTNMSICTNNMSVASVIAKSLLKSSKEAECTEHSRKAKSLPQPTCASGIPHFSGFNLPRPSANKKDALPCSR